MSPRLGTDTLSDLIVRGSVFRGIGGLDELDVAAERAAGGKDEPVAGPTGVVGNSDERPGAGEALVEPPGLLIPLVGPVMDRDNEKG